MDKGRIIEQGAPAALLAAGSGTRTLDFCSRLAAEIDRDA
jgi:polar amino acid transport system ATP-binding protein